VGKTDTPLTHAGRQQVERLEKSFRRLAPSHVLSSPLRRCSETAEILLKNTDLALECDPDLREIDFGRWEGLTFQEIAARDPRLVEQWALGGMDFCFPEGESLVDFWDRIGRVAQRLRETPCECVLAVTHAGVIRFLLCHFLGLDTQFHLRFDIRPAAITRLDFQDGEAVLASMNEYCSEEAS
jgi:alpha-ribazole phosphatase